MQIRESLESKSRRRSRYRRTSRYRRLPSASLAMFSRVVARVSVRCCLVSQQKEKGVGPLLRLLRASVIGRSEARYSTSVSACESSEAIMSGDEKKPFRRLPLCVRPYHYDISLTPNLATFTFNGTESVHLDVSCRL